METMWRGGCLVLDFFSKEGNLIQNAIENSLFVERNLGIGIQLVSVGEAGTTNSWENYTDPNKLCTI